MPAPAAGFGASCEQYSGAGLETNRDVTRTPPGGSFFQLLWDFRLSDYEGSRESLLDSSSDQKK